MRLRTAALVWFVCALAAVLTAQNIPLPPSIPINPVELVREAMASDREDWQRLKDYYRVERSQTDELDRKGNIKKTESVTREVIVIYGEPIERVIERNDKPLSPEEARKEQQRYDEVVSKLEKETAAERSARLERIAKSRDESRKFVDEVTKAFDITYLGEGRVNGRATYLLEGYPRKDYKPTSRETKILSKVHGLMWIDKQTHRWVQLRADFVDDVSFGWILGKLHRGTTAEVRQVLLPDGIWVPLDADLKIDARALFRGIRSHVQITYRDYKKFGSDSKITGYAEIEQRPSPAPPKVPQQPPPPQKRRN